MLRFLKPFDAYKIHRLNVSYLALVNNSCASQREGSVFFSSCYFFFSDISVVSVLELCSHSGEISLHLLGLQELIYSKESISHFVLFVPHPCDGCCIEFVARLLSAQWKTFPQVSASDVHWNSWSSPEGGGGEGGATPLYKPYRYVRPQRVWFLSRFGLKYGIDFDYFGLKIGYGMCILICRRSNLFI